jgi:crotonobetainyl-CoA:carnitine CoA-transferase CaiB-like acyl-CoA transferase
MLKDLVVIDASTVLAGPSVATFFAELGAKVIKVEHPNNHDTTRNWKLPSENKNSAISAYFSSINYLKEYAQLDLKNVEDHASFMKLIESADILISNFKSGNDVKLNITDQQLFAANPKLIIGKISGYGEDDDRVAYDLILQAESGFMSMNGTPESGPVKMPVALIDVLSAHHLKEGLLLALYERQQTGKGKSINVSLYDAAISSLTNQASNYLMSGHIPQRIGSSHPNISPYGELFTTVDDVTITFAIGSNIHFRKLCEVLDLNILTSDDRYSENQQRVINRKELQREIQEKVSTRSSLVLLQKLEELHVPAGKVKNLKEVFEDEAAKKLVRSEIIDDVQTKRVTSVVFK